jgi:hypothetical protein
MLHMRKKTRRNLAGTAKQHGAIVPGLARTLRTDANELINAVDRDSCVLGLALFEAVVRNKTRLDENARHAKLSNKAISAAGVAGGDANRAISIFRNSQCIRKSWRGDPPLAGRRRKGSR